LPKVKRLGKMYLVATCVWCRNLWLGLWQNQGWG